MYICYCLYCVHIDRCTLNLPTTYRPWDFPGSFTGTSPGVPRNACANSAVRVFTCSGCGCGSGFLIATLQKLVLTHLDNMAGTRFVLTLILVLTVLVALSLAEEDGIHTPSTEESGTNVTSGYVEA